MSHAPTTFRGPNSVLYHEITRHSDLRVLKLLSAVLPPSFLPSLFTEFGDSGWFERVTAAMMTVVAFFLAPSPTVSGPITPLSLSLPQRKSNSQRGGRERGKATDRKKQLGETEGEQENTVIAGEADTFIFVQAS